MMAENSLKDRTIKGTVWSAADAFLGQGVTFIVGIILARLLSPDEYGLIGICLIFNTVLNGIVDSGFSNALIRKKDVSNDEYNTMFLTNMAISIVLYVLLFFSTPFISTFFKRPELTSLIRATSLILFLNALSLTHVTILTKQIDFKTKTKASVISAILSGMIGIWMAYTNFGVWALVGQMLSKQLFYTLSLWFFIKWWPTLRFSKEAFHYMWGFGWKLLVSGILNNLWNQLYQVVIGKFYSPASLGQYTRAEQYASIFSSNLNSIVMNVSFPVLSKVQDNEDRMVAIYRKIIKVTMFVTAISMLALAGISEPMIRVLIGDQWLQAATFLPFICISLSLYPLHAINLNMLKVLGRSDLFLIYEILKKFVSVIPICLGIFVGIYAMLIGSVVTGIISFFINSWYTGKRLGYTSWKQLLDIAPNYAIGTVIFVSIYFIKYLPLSPFVVLPIQFIVATIVFFILAETTKLQQYLEIKEIALKAISKVWKR